MSSVASRENLNTSNVDVAIIGAGACGVLVAVHLLASTSPPKKIVLIEKRPNLATGVAYSTIYPEHLLNVTSNRMSAFDDEPGDFVEFIKRTQLADSTTSPCRSFEGHFAERRMFSRYLQDCLARYSAEADVQLINDEAMDVAFGANTATIQLRSGQRINARSVVLAIGNSARRFPLADADMRINNAWDYAAVKSLSSDEDVLIVGSGLSMVDAVLTLSEQKHRGRIHVLSRHGLFPHAHASTSRRDNRANAFAGHSLKQLTRLIRQTATRETNAGSPWQYVMDDLRPYNQALWVALSEVEQRRFMRHLARYWDIHRHRIAPAAYDVLQRLLDVGQLSRWAGRLQTLQRQEGVYDAGIALSADAAEISLRVHRVINATGLQLDLRFVDSPLLRNLFARGLIQPGPHGMGLKTDPRGGILSASGALIPGFYTLGSARIGELWESIAIPELRTQAQVLSQRILRSAISASPEP